MSFIQKILDNAGRQGRAAPKGDDGTQDATLSVSASDAGWSAKLVDGDGTRWQRRACCFPEPNAATPAERLAEAVACLAADQPQANVARVILFMDDPDLELVDHRFAKLNNFEPRGLKEFGSQQVGGRPVAFGSLPFGDSSAREIQKRVLGFLPEEKLATYFFSLGKMATALIAAVPAGACAFDARSHEGGIFATLRVHGYFSTLLIANAQTGIIAMRQFSFGSLSLAAAYAAEHGLSLTESSAALGARSRLPPANIVKDGGAPEHQTGTFAALSPLLQQIREDIAATIDYFRFQRLAGRPAHLGLTFTGPSLAGLDSWLADALGLQVEIVENTLSTSQDATDTSNLNLLEGSRAALLKMGNQPFEFSKGRFVAMSGGRSDMPTRKPEEKFSFPWLDKLNDRLGGRQITFTRERLMRPFAAFGVLGLLVIANMYLLTGPAEQHLTDGVFAYGSAAEASVASIKGGAANAQNSDQPALWADNLLAVGQALSLGMKLERLELAPAAGKGGTGVDLNLAITGGLPSATAGNFKSVAVFIDQLSKDKAFSSRFPQLRFTGAGKSTDQTRREMNFHVAALSEGSRR
jgi:hypothetical protein